MPRTDNSAPVKPVYANVAPELKDAFVQACREAGVPQAGAIEWGMQKFIDTVKKMRREG